jgi:hypothetical protein
VPRKFYLSIPLMAGGITIQTEPALTSGAPRRATGVRLLIARFTELLISTTGHPSSESSLFNSPHSPPSRSTIPATGRAPGRRQRTPIALVKEASPRACSISRNVSRTIDPFGTVDMAWWNFRSSNFIDLVTPISSTPKTVQRYHTFAGSPGPAPKLSLHRIFNYILKILYLGCQWKELQIHKDSEGQPETHYTRIHRIWRPSSTISRTARCDAA